MGFIDYLKKEYQKGKAYTQERLEERAKIKEVYAKTLKEERLKERIKRAEKRAKERAKNPAFQKFLKKRGSYDKSKLVAFDAQIGEARRGIEAKRSEQKRKRLKTITKTVASDAMSRQPPPPDYFGMRDVIGFGFGGLDRGAVERLEREYNPLGRVNEEYNPLGKPKNNNLSRKGGQKTKKYTILEGIA